MKQICMNCRHWTPTIDSGICSKCDKYCEFDDVCKYFTRISIRQIIKRYIKK